MCVHITRVTCEIYRLLMKKPVDVQLERPV